MSAVSHEELAAFLDEIESRCRRRVSAVDPLSELAKLGLAPTAGEVPVWAEMSPIHWFVLLRGLARCDPQLAAALSSLRLASDQGCEPCTGWALHARRCGDRWQFDLRAPAGPYAPWVFCDGVFIREVPVAAMRQAGRGRVECAAFDAVRSGCAPASLLSRIWRDRLALINGCLWRLWTVTVDHAESRPMFRRHLGDFPGMRLRLLRLLAELLRVDELAERAAAASPASASAMDLGASLMGALRLCANFVRVETQQICGGTGYMRESRYAQTLVWLDWCDGLMRLGPIAGGMLAESLAAEIEQSLAERFAQVGIPADLRAVLLRRPASRRSERAAKQAA